VGRVASVEPARLARAVLLASWDYETRRTVSGAFLFWSDATLPNYQVKAWSVRDRIKEVPPLFLVVGEADSLEHT